MNKFTQSLTKRNSYTENYAVSNSSTGDAFADQFGKAGSYRFRAIEQAFADQSALHAIDIDKALKFVFYLRLITRIPYALGNNEFKISQKGQGQRDESLKRFLWYGAFQPELFSQNLFLLPVIGRYQDLIDLFIIGKKHRLKINYDELVGTYAKALPNSDLAKKYLPLFKSKRKVNTERAKYRNEFAKLLAAKLGISYAELRAIKSSGNAHQWQQKISKQQYTEIDWNRVSGRAITQLTSNDFLIRHEIEEKFMQWIESKTAVAFTGYPYELVKNVKADMSRVSKYTIDKQFETLLKGASSGSGGITGNVWCALDTSGSMKASVANTNALNICLGLGVFFSTLNTGAFHNHIIMFDNISRVKELSGSFTDKVLQIKQLGVAWGSTNFQSIIDEIVRIKTDHPDIPIADFPNTLLIVSDMQFNPTGTTETNHEMMMRKLGAVFPAEWVDQFKVIWWDCTGRVESDFPSRIDDGGTYVFSGFDCSIISLLLGGEAPELSARFSNQMVESNISMTGVIDTALNQEVLQLVNSSSKK